jgi:hypothetical protein
MSDANTGEPASVRGMVRQGNVLLVPVDRAVGSRSDVPVEEKVVLAVGERTGHAHVVRNVRVLLTQEHPRSLAGRHQLNPTVPR